jgi:hypothetical protein
MASMSSLRFSSGGTWTAAIWIDWPQNTTTDQVSTSIRRRMLFRIGFFLSVGVRRIGLTRIDCAWDSVQYNSQGRRESLVAATTEMQRVCLRIFAYPKQGLEFGGFTSAASWRADC